MTKSFDWQRKQAEFLAGGTIEVVEDELNAWAAAQSAPPAAAGTAKPATPDATPAPEPTPEFLALSRPNFHVAGDRLQIAVQVTVNYSGLSTTTLALVTGTFTKKDEEVIFSAEKVYLGSCPIHLLPGLRQKSADWVMSSLKLTDDQRVAWTKVERVSLGGGMVKIAVR